MALSFLTREFRASIPPRPISSAHLTLRSRKVPHQTVASRKRSFVMAFPAKSYTCLRCRLASISTPSRSLLPLNQFRSYAVTVGEPSSTTNEPRRPATRFSDRLNAGPSFSDFVGGTENPLSREDALELRTVVVGPPGKQKTITRLPEWLKTPIPEGDNFKRLKNDLRGLNLHTGMVSADACGFYILRTP